MLRNFFILGLAIVLSIGGINLINYVEAKEVGVPSYFRLSVDPDKHNDYGFTYPVTYQFSIFSDSSDLKAYKRHTESGNWVEIIEKTSENFFNGIEAVRFDWNNNKAYISVAFSDESDEIFLKIVDQWGSPVVTWDCRNKNGQEVARGIYVYLAATFGGERKVGKIAVVK